MFNEDKARAKLKKLAAAWRGGPAKVRMLLGGTGRLEIEASELKPLPRGPLLVALAKRPVNSADIMLQHKSTRRGVYERARRDFPEADEVLLYNERGCLTELCSANLVLRLDGRLITPPREDGLLAGTMRARLLDRGVIGERSVSMEDLQRAQGLWLVNSVRGRRRICLAGPVRSAGHLLCENIQ
jgi:para-aminobenzoate synthetase/4-amino-4-deoxychorismate lyase